MGGGWRIARVGKTDIIVRPSLILMGILLVIVFAPQFESMGAGPNPYLTAGVFVVALYLSVLLHEVAHWMVARWFGMEVSAVELHLLGGETRIGGDSRHPWQEFTTSFVGPLASVLLGLASFWAAQGTEGVAHAILWSLGFINLLIAAFNMLPGLPLDGGRVLRSFIWAITGSEARGVRVAGWIGRGAAVLLLVVAVFTMFGEGVFAIGRGLLVLAVALFLWQGASAALKHGVIMARVSALNARRLMQDETPPTGAVPISDELVGRALLVAMAENPADAYALVDADGAVVGTLFSESVDRAYRESR